MIFSATQRDESAIYETIGTAYAAALYLYIDIKKYGFSSPHLRVWLERETETAPIRLVIMQYYTGMVLFSNHPTYAPAPVSALITAQKPSIISGMQPTLAPLHALLPAYESETGIVGEITAPAFPRDAAVSRALPADMGEIATLLMADEGLGGHYEIESLKNQLLERQADGFGRNYILRQNGRIVAHAATYAELNDIAVVSGVLTSPALRGKGLMRRIYPTLCADLLREGKRVFACYYVPPAIALHHRIGFLDAGVWEKLLLKPEK